MTGEDKQGGAERPVSPDVGRATLGATGITPDMVGSDALATALSGSTPTPEVERPHDQRVADAAHYALGGETILSMGMD